MADVPLVSISCTVAWDTERAVPSTPLNMPRSSRELTLDAVLPWALSDIPAECEVDRMNGCGEKSNVHTVQRAPSRWACSGSSWVPIKHFAEITGLLELMLCIHTHTHRYTLSNPHSNPVIADIFLSAWYQRALIHNRLYFCQRSALQQHWAPKESIWKNLNTQESGEHHFFCSAASSHYGVGNSTECKVFYQEADKERANMPSSHSYSNLRCNIETRL